VIVEGEYAREVALDVTELGLAEKQGSRLVLVSDFAKPAGKAIYAPDSDASRPWRVNGLQRVGARANAEASCQPERLAVSLSFALILILVR
jgi:hypothetical protein